MKDFHESLSLRESHSWKCPKVVHFHKSLSLSWKSFMKVFPVSASDLLLHFHVSLEIALQVYRQVYNVLYENIKSTYSCKMWRQPLTLSEYLSISACLSTSVVTDTCFLSPVFWACDLLPTRILFGLFAHRSLDFCVFSQKNQKRAVF